MAGARDGDGPVGYASERDRTADIPATQTPPEPTPSPAGAMARGGSGSPSPSPSPASGAATFRLTEGASLTLPDGCTATVRQGALELSDGQRVALPAAGGVLTIERRVTRPDGRAALVRHTIRVGQVGGDAKPADAAPEPKAADAAPEPKAADGAPEPVEGKSDQTPVPTDKAPADAQETVDKASTETQATTDNTPAPADEVTTDEAASTDNVPSEESVSVDKAPVEESMPPAGVSVPTDVTTEESVPTEKASPDSPVSPAETSSEAPVEEPVDTTVSTIEGTVSGDCSTDALPQTSTEGGEQEPSEDGSRETPANVPDEVGKEVVEVPHEIQDNTQTPGDIQNTTPDSAMGEVPAVSDEAQQLTPVEVPTAAPNDTQVAEEPAEKQRNEAPVQNETSSSTTPENNTTGQTDASPEGNDHAEIQEQAVTPEDDVTINAGSDGLGESANPASILTDIPLHSSTPKHLSAIPEGTSTHSSPPKGDSVNLDSSTLSADQASPKAEQTSASKIDSVLPLSSSLKDFLSPVAEADEPSFENHTQPYCEWARSQSIDKPNNPVDAIQETPPETVSDASRSGQGENKPPAKEAEGEDDDEERATVAEESRLAHHDSLRLPSHVPRLRRRSEGESVQVDRHSPCGRKAVSYMKDPLKKRQEDEAMRTKLNSILHKLGYGAPGSAGSDGDASSESGQNEADVSQRRTPPRQDVDGPEEPEPVSVPKVISFFESITPQRMESPVERRKWRSSDRSPSARRSPRNARSPEPAREKSEERPSPSLRRVNFADSAQRVLITSTSEPDEMENIPIPLSSPDHDTSQPCWKASQPVVTTQPTRLTAIHAQNSPNDTPKESSEAPAVAQVQSQRPASSAGAASDPLSSSGVQADEDTSEESITSVVPATSELTATPASDKPEPVTRNKDSKDDQELEDAPDSSETTPLITSSATAKITNLPASGTSPNGVSADPIQAEPLPRPSPVAVQGDLIISDYPVSQTTDATELDDGEPRVMLIGDGTDEADRGGPSDPFLPDGEAHRRSDAIATKSSSWLEDCLEICCCCWAP